MFFAFLIFLLIACCQAQIPQPGPCKKLEITDFNTTKILGRWYRYAAYPTPEPVGKCGRDIFIGGPDDSMTIIQKKLSTVSGALPIWDRVYRFKYLGGGIYRMTYPMDDPFFNQTLTFSHTDYVTYALMSTCVSIGHASVIYAFIMTREPQPPPCVLAKIDEAAKVDGLIREYFQKENQTHCPTDF